MEKATTSWSRHAELHKFRLAKAGQLSLGQPIPLHMLWCCVLMCRVQHSNEAPCRLADDEVLTIPTPSRSGPDHMRVIHLLFGYCLSYVLDHTGIGSLVLASAVQFLTAWRSAIRSGSELTEQAGASASKSMML